MWRIASRVRNILGALVRGLVLATLAVWLCVGSAYPQQPAPPSPASETAKKLGELSPQERVDLIAKLDDTQIRELVLYYLVQTAAPKPAETRPEDVFRDLEQRGDLLRANTIETLKSVSELPAAIEAALSKVAAGSSAVGGLGLLIALAALIAAGALVEWLYRLAVHRVREQLNAVAKAGSTGWLRTTVAVFFLDLVGIALFATGYVLAFLAVWQGNGARRQLSAAILVGIVVVRLTRSAAWALLGPESTGERIIPVTETGARHLYRAAFHTVLAGVLLLIPAYLLGNWSGNYHVRLLLMAMTGAAFSIYAAIQVWNVRQHAAGAFLSTAAAQERVGWPMRALAYAWAPLLIAYIAAVYFFTAVSALAGAPIGITRAAAALLVMLVGLPVLDRLIGFALQARGPVFAGEGTIGHPGLVLRRAARIVLVVGAVLLVLGIFGLGSVATQRIGAWLIRLTLDIGLVVLIAYILRELTIAWISRRLAKEIPPGTPGANNVEVARASRLKTILPLVQRALQVAIITIAALMILSALGVNVGPLLAGAGVIGLAVGFGSQTLVKDLISGLFFLLDDAFRVGEYIEVEGFSGEVERINVRSLSLRTPLGAIHTIPFGGINAIANYSRDWAIVKLEFRVTYDTDMGKVKKIFRKIGEDLEKDPELGPGFLQPFKFQGVKAMEETGILLRGKFMAIPGTQFQIRKAIFERVQKDFAANGIEFAQRRVQVNLPPGQAMDDDAAREAVRNAAADAVVAAQTTRA